VGENGVVHSGDSPPENIKAKRVDVEAHSTEHESPKGRKIAQDADETYRRIEEDRKRKAASRQAAGQRANKR
jgi:hypothetical protein